MLKRNITIFIILLGVVFECHGAGRRSMRASFVQAQARTPQPQNDKIAPAQPTDDVAVRDVAPDVVASDDVIDEITVEAHVSATNNTEPLLTDAELDEITSQLNGIVTGLQSEINALNSEIVLCQQEKKTNTILTVVGGVGVLGTGIGAIVQGKKIHDAKKAGAVEKQDSQDNQKASE